MVKSVGKWVRRIQGRNKAGKLVWRMSAASPLGEYVHTAEPEAEPRREADAPAPTARAVVTLPSTDGAPEVTERGWHDSSHDLARGSEVRETPFGNLPDELFDLLIKKRP